MISFQRLRFSAAHTHCRIVIFVHCLMLSMYCFRDLPRLRLPSTYPSTREGDVRLVSWHYSWLPGHFGKRAGLVPALPLLLPPSWSDISQYWEPCRCRYDVNGSIVAAIHNILLRHAPTQELMVSIQLNAVHLMTLPRTMCNCSVKVITRVIIGHLLLIPMYVELIMIHELLLTGDPAESCHQPRGSLWAAI